MASSVTIVTRLRTGKWVPFPTGEGHGEGKVFALFTTASRPALGPTQPSMQWVPAALTPGIKRPGREADHPPPSNPGVTNVWSYTSTPPYVFKMWHLVKHSDSCTFIFTNVNE